MVHIMHTVLYGVCVNADLLTHEHVASTSEHAESCICPQCVIERLVTHANHLLYITCPSMMMEGIQQTQHTDL